ncbi:hypothetical protein NZF17_005237 [Salmonella enterica]|nr:hypothetical protein [Salmonella enterica]
MSKELIVNNFEAHMENAILGLELKNEVYSFDLSEYLDCFFSSISTDYFHIVFCFVESDGKIREEVVKKIKMEIA